MTRPGPKPNPDRDSVRTIRLAQKWSPNDLERIESARKPGEAIGTAIRRLALESAQ